MAYNMQKTHLEQQKQYTCAVVINKQQCVGGRAFFLVSPLDSRCSSDNTSGTFTHHCPQFIGK